MNKLRDLQSKILVDGEDLRLTEEDVSRIRAHLGDERSIDVEDLKILAQMRAQARVVSDSFDQFFFPAFKSWLLADGKVSLAEQFEILRVLYGGGRIDATERQFLTELRRDAKEVSPEFEALYQQAITD